MDNLADPVLPQRIWWPWDQPAGRVGFWADFDVECSCLGCLYVSCSGEYQVWIDGNKIPVVEAYLPSWRRMHKVLVDLAPGSHRLFFEARSGPNTQSFLLANLDWETASRSGHPPESHRLATGPSWWMVLDPPPDWANIGGCELESRPAWAFDGVWAEPWGFPCNAPDDYCRMSHLST